MLITNAKDKVLISQAMGIICALPQIAFCMIWGIVAEPRPTSNFEIRVGTIVMECSTASLVWITCALVYLAFLLAISWYLSFKGQKLSTQPSELRFISFSITFSTMVFLAFVPAYNSTQGKFAEVTKIFAIISSNYGIFGCIFLPKCYKVLNK